MFEEHLGGRVRLACGDSRDVLKELADCSIDSVVCDPPYALVSIVKRFGGEGAAPAIGNDAYARASAGFMGQSWDTGETAFAVEFWAEVMRVLKPGGYVIAASGTRTYHRLAVAIEDAGFEIRDMISWLYGSGFPKSHDVSKGIDKRGGANIAWFGSWLRAERERRGITQKSLAAHFLSKTGRITGCVANWELGLNIPTAEQFNSLCRILDLPFSEISEAQRQVIGEISSTLLAVAPGQDNDRSAVTLEITESGSPEAAAWDGWGTALKPACEPWVLARKPLTGTVAANVLEHGTGALNIDGCRIHGEDAPAGQYTVKRLKPGADLNRTGGNWRPSEDDAELYHGELKAGRWPANVIHDGSAEVVDAFPDSNGQQGDLNGQSKGRLSKGIYGDMPAVRHHPARNDSGSAARFFYSAKADADDRLGSKHPTVKPVDLMQYLCRLVTPPGGTVLDPFAGSGTTGEAAYREGFDAILIEREVGFAQDIRDRLALCSAGPASRKRATAAKKAGDVALGGVFA